jgi:DNA-directed RNA polymerase subunit RPC12/RpoP
MEAEVIHVEFKKKEKPKARMDYYCMRCNESIFKLSANSEINCSGCGSLMRNLYVSLYPPERS